MQHKTTEVLKTWALWDVLNKYRNCPNLSDKYLLETEITDFFFFLSIPLSY